MFLSTRSPSELLQLAPTSTIYMSQWPKGLARRIAHLWHLLQPSNQLHHGMELSLHFLEVFFFLLIGLFLQTLFLFLSNRINSLSSSLYCFIWPNQHTNSMTLYSESVPKRPDITGSVDQAYSLTSMFDAVVKAISANLIAGIMGCQHTGEIFHLFCLKVHHCTAGNPVAIIGNLSNTIGQFMCARITKSEFSLFTVVGKKSDAPPTHGDTIDPAIMAKTTLNANIDFVVCLAYPPKLFQSNLYHGKPGRLQCLH